MAFERVLASGSPKGRERMCRLCFIFLSSDRRSSSAKSRHWRIEVTLRFYSSSFSPVALIPYAQQFFVASIPV